MVKTKGICLICDREFEFEKCPSRKGRGRYCSRKCYVKSRTGKIIGGRQFKEKGEHPRWKGGKRSYLGYKAREILKKKGIEIPDGYVVHHINRNRRDNRIENLQILPNRSEHMKLHWQQGDLGGIIKR